MLSCLHKMAKMAPDPGAGFECEQPGGMCDGDTPAYVRTFWGDHYGDIHVCLTDSLGEYVAEPPYFDKGGVVHEFSHLACETTDDPTSTSGLFDSINADSIAAIVEFMAEFYRAEANAE